MGTRADFYIGKGATAEWIGSIAWDGDRDCLTESMISARDDTEFRAAAMEFFATGVRTIRTKTNNARSG